MILKGADIDRFTDIGQTPLGICIQKNNKKLAAYLIGKNVKMFIERLSLRNMSPFIVAINCESLWAIEMFCDHGCNINTPTSGGMTPIMYAAAEGHDEICMYLSLRTDKVDQYNE